MIIRNKKGNAAIILCLVITALLGFTAYVVDIGIAYIEKTKLSNAIDSSILAASLELPENKSSAQQVALDYLNKNKVDPNKTTITISDDGKSIQIDGERNVNHLFAPIIGINNSTVHASAKAILGPIKSITGGIRPFAVEKYDFSYGEQVTLKDGAGDSYHGNYGAVALGGTGTSTFRANALYGYNGKLSVGDIINTDTGVMAGATNDISNYINSEQSTFDNFQRDSIRLWTLPLVDSMQVDGTKPVQVTGFGEFFVESVGNNSGHMEITGRFLRYVTKGEIDTTLDDTGSYGVKLVK